MMQNLTDRITAILNDLDPADLVDLHNRYCSDCNNVDDQCFYMEDLDDILGEDITPTRVIGMTGKHMDIRDDIFWFDSYGYLESCRMWDARREAPIFPSDIARAMVRWEDAMGVEEVQELFDIWDWSIDQPREDEDEDDPT